MPCLISNPNYSNLLQYGSRTGSSAGYGSKYNFVNFVYKSKDIEESVLSISRNIIDNSPYGVRCSKKAIDGRYLADIKEGLIIERNQYNISVNTKDRKEALDAFKEKRKPKWRNK